MNNNEHRIPLTVKPAHVKFYSWKPFILSIDERQRHTLITGTYVLGQKRYLSNIISQDIAHIRYTERYSHLIPSYEHSQMVKGLTVITSGRSRLKMVVEQNINKNNNRDARLIKKGSDRLTNEKDLLHEVNQIDLLNHVEEGGIMHIEYDPEHSEESIMAINTIMKNLSKKIPSRDSLFVHSIVIEDVDMFLRMSKEFATYYSRLSQDRRANGCAMSVNCAEIQKDEQNLHRGFKNRVAINLENSATAHLTKCGKKETFNFMPFSPVEQIIHGDLK